MEEYITHSVQDTEALGEKIASRLKTASVLAMYGPLGAGKTAFTRGLAKGFNCICGAVSPTYTIVNQYPGDRDICHFDMYRINSEDALYDIGWEDYLMSGALCVVEWSENIEGALPKDAVRVEIVPIDENTRKIRVFI